MSLAAFLEELRQAGISIEVVAGELEVIGPEEAMTHGLLKVLTARKQECLAFLSGGDEPGWSRPDSDRRGLVEWRNGLFLHFCHQCGRWGGMGQGVDLPRGRLGRWYCPLHWPGGVKNVSKQQTT